MNLVIDDAVEVTMPPKKGGEEEGARRELGKPCFRTLQLWVT